MMTRRPKFVAPIARHRLTHPDESAYQTAKHLSIPSQAAKRASDWLDSHDVRTDSQALDFLARNPIITPEFHLRHERVAEWLAKPPAPLSVSGEDAAAVEGYDLVPHRHLFYVRPEDRERVVDSLRAAGADFAEPSAANVTLRVRDPWLIDEPHPLVERGQRLLDYRQSRHPILARSVRVGP